MYVSLWKPRTHDNTVDQIPSFIEFLTTTDMAGNWKVQLQIHWIFAFLFRLST